MLGQRYLSQYASQSDQHMSSPRPTMPYRFGNFAGTTMSHWARSEAVVVAAVAAPGTFARRIGTGPASSQ